MEKILIVEDEEVVRDYLSEILSGLGYNPITSVDGEDGLKKFYEHDLSMILTDIRMPVMDGLSMLKKIRSEDPSIPIIVITGFPTVDSAVKSLVAGADYYLVKPINIDDLKAKMVKAFDKRKMISGLTLQKKINRFLLYLIPFWLILGFFIAHLISF
ncbi:MAG: response regulator [bacterium]